jgi:hypothetical protein
MQEILLAVMFKHLVLAYFMVNTYYTKILSNSKASFLFYCWASEDGLEGPKHVMPYK